MFGRLQRRFRFWLGQSDRARLLREEMDAHIELKTEELIDAGLSVTEARASAHRHFGNVRLKQEEARETWVARWLSDFVQDTVFTARTIRKQPGFTAVAAISSALGIGACSLIFGLANFALFRPLPVDDPSHLMSVYGRQLTRGKLGQSLAYPDFEDLSNAHSLDGLAAYFQFMPAILASNGAPQRYWGSLTTANYFDVVRPVFVVGRGFDPSRDDIPGAAPVVVLSHQLWRSRFAGDPSIIGRNIEMNSRKVTVVGVIGPGFRGTEVMFYSDFWVPLSMANELAMAGMGGDRLHDRGGQWLMAVGRLRDGVSQAAMNSEIDLIGGRLRNAYPVTNKDRAFYVERAGQMNPGFRRLVLGFFALLTGVAVLVLCTACANVANLLLARASARQREIATRLAIGAGRGRLLRQLLTESVILASLGGVGGFALAQLCALLISRSRIPLPLPVDFSLSLDGRVMLFCTVLSALTGLVFGLAPALRATRPDLVSGLKDEGMHLGQSRTFGLRNLLVVGQVTMCMVLLICSGLFLRSLQSANTIDTGIGNRNLLLMAFDPSLNRYTQDETRRVVDAILNQTRAIPGVESVALTSSVPLSMEGTQNAFSPEVPSGGDNRGIIADIYSVGVGFFETFGIRRLAGEDFRPSASSEDIVIMNQEAAKRAFAGQNPVGRYISYFGRRVRVIGLVATAKSRSIGEDPRAGLYFPIARELKGNDSLTGMTLALRTRGNPASYAPLVRNVVRGIDPTLPLFDVRSMEDHLSQALFLPRASAYLFGLAGFMGLLIATVGLYGVISFAVARQTKEIGIRMAMGATRAQVLVRILRHGLALSVIGSTLGLGLALALARVTASLLYGVSPTDAVTFVTVPSVLIVISLAACLIPARRAASLDPLQTLRYE